MFLLKPAFTIIYQRISHDLPIQSIRLCQFWIIFSRTLASRFCFRLGAAAKNLPPTVFFSCSVVNSKAIPHSNDLSFQQLRSGQLIPPGGNFPWVSSESLVILFMIFMVILMVILMFMIFRKHCCLCEILRVKSEVSVLFKNDATKNPHEFQGLLVVPRFWIKYDTVCIKILHQPKIRSFGDDLPSFTSWHVVMLLFEIPSQMHAKFIGALVYWSPYFLVHTHICIYIYRLMDG